MSGPSYQVRTVHGSGRGLFAAVDIAEGETFLSEDPYFLVTLVSKHNVVTCNGCLKQFPAVLPHPRCGQKCGEHYCSDQCLVDDITRHERFGECAALQRILPAQGELSVDDYNHLRGIAVLAARLKVEGHADGLRAKAWRRGGAKAVHVLWGSDTPDEAGLWPLPDSSYAALGRVNTNEALFGEDQLVTFRDIHAKCTECSAAADSEEGSDDDSSGDESSDANSRTASFSSPLPQISLEMFLRLSCAYQCNGFSVWNEYDKETASGMYGMAAMVNHSCVPNIAKQYHGRRLVFVAKRSIQHDEELLLSYVDVKLGQNLRQWRFQNQYFFTCRCQRCDGKK